MIEQNIYNIVIVSGKQCAGNEKIGSTNYVILQASCVRGRAYVMKSEISTGEQIKSVYYNINYKFM